jgi:hypothetical protein
MYEGHAGCCVCLLHSISPLSVGDSGNVQLTCTQCCSWPFVGCLRNWHREGRTFVKGVNNIRNTCVACNGMTFETEHTLLKSVCCVASTPFAMFVNQLVVFCMATWPSTVCGVPLPPFTRTWKDNGPWRKTVGLRHDLPRECNSGVSRRRCAVQDWHFVCEIPDWLAAAPPFALLSVPRYTVAVTLFGSELWQ